MSPHRRILKKTNEPYFINQLLTESKGSIFSLVRLATIRALELDSGKPSLVQNTFTDKATTIALEEIAQGKVTFDVLKNNKKKKGAAE